MWVAKIRVTGRPPSALANSSRQSREVSSPRSPVSTSAQPSPSAIAHRLMWFNANGIGMRIQCTPGTTSSVVPRSGGASNG